MFARDFRGGPNTQDEFPNACTNCITSGRNGIKKVKIFRVGRSTFRSRTCIGVEGTVSVVGPPMGWLAWG